MSLSKEIPKTESAGTKLSIVHGQFALRVPEGTEDSVARELTKGPHAGEEVHELLYPTLEGMLSSGEVRELPYGLSCEVTIIDGDEVYTVQLSSDSKYFTALATRLPNINRNIPISLSLVEHKTKRTKKGDPVVMLMVIQDNKRIADHFVKWSKDEAGNNIATHLHGLPDVKKTRSGWDFADQIDFYLGRFEDYFKGEGSADQAAPPPPETAADEPPAVDPAAAEPGVVDGMLAEEDDGSDSLPF